MNTLKECMDKLTKLYLLVALSIFIITFKAQAKFLVEPQYRVYQGDYKGDGIKGSLKGEGSSINLGYIGKHFMAGVSAEKGWLNFNKSLVDAGPTNFTYGGFGTFLGFHFFNRIKIYTGYMNTSIEPSNDSSFRYFGQEAYFGIGYRLWDFVLLNYDYMSNVYTQLEDDNTGKTSGLDSNFKTTKQSIGLSCIFIF